MVPPFTWSGGSSRTPQGAEGVHSPDSVAPRGAPHRGFRELSRVYGKTQGGVIELTPGPGAADQ